MRYRLRTLMIVLAIGPPMLAGGYFWWQHAIEWTITSVEVLVAIVATFYAVALVGMLAQRCWEKYWRLNRPE